MAKLPLIFQVLMYCLLFLQTIAVDGLHYSPFFVSTTSGNNRDGGGGEGRLLKSWIISSPSNETTAFQNYRLVKESTHSNVAAKEADSSGPYGITRFLNLLRPTAVVESATAGEIDADKKHDYGVKNYS
jgi:hypothetical protein